MRRDGGPRFLYCDTYRLAPHSKGDDIRPRAEIELAAARSPIARLKAGLPRDLTEQIDREAEKRIDEVVASLMVRDDNIS
jgi:TPP-dependent pyruvate/acetoin dehydrogenase alpha subunit